MTSVASPGAVARPSLRGRRLLVAFSFAAVGAGVARALTTTYLPVLLERIEDAPSLIGVVMAVNAVAGFVVPLAVGLWSDRRQAGGLGRRLPFMIGGTALTAGGLIAVGLGSGSSYLALGLAAAVVYTGLNALTTGHRAIVADDVSDDRRPAATSAQELATVVGAGAAVGIGGALIEPAPGVAFALAAVVLVAAALPTLLVSRRLGLGSPDAPPPTGGVRASLAGALRHPGAREVLLAQTLWVFAYAALPAFFVLYAEKELGLGLGAAGALPLAFGILIAVGMVAGGRARSEQVHRLLLTGAALLGLGLLAAAMTTNVGVVALSLLPAALGAGLVTSLGFPYFARFVPAGEAGGYSGVFFAGRGIASTIALPLAGLTVSLTGTYRSVFLLGAASIVALVPLIVAERRMSGVPILRPRPRSIAAVMPAPARLAVLREWSPRLAAMLGATIALGAALPALQPLDNAAFLVVNRLGDGPEWLYQALDPHARNYLLLFLVAVLGSAAVMRRPRYVLGTGLAVLLAGYLAGAALEVVKLFIDRARPEEALGAQVLLSEGRDWSHIASFPSGHMIVTTALATVGAMTVPRLRWPLIAYVVAVGFTRILFGAHFPLDVVVGTVLGYEIGLFAVALIANAKLLPAGITRPARAPEPRIQPEHAMGSVRT